MRLLVKIGGTLVDDPASRDAIAREISAMQKAGHRVVVVHGGGRQLTRFLQERGIASRFVDGLRVTDGAAMDAVVKVLAGSVNKQLTGAVRAAGANAVGLSGMDGRLTTASQMSEELGWVGRVNSVDATLLALLTDAAMIPIVACVAGDEQGLAWNINADQMAVACASAFGVDRLIFLTDVAGVLDAAGAILPVLDAERIRVLIDSGVAKGGMRAKLSAGLDALNGGIPSIVIAPGSGARILERLMAGDACGTEIRK